MSTEKIIQESIAVFKQTLGRICAEQDGTPLTVDKLSQFSSGMMEALQQAGLTGLKVFLEEHDTDAPTVEVDGEPRRFKGKGRKVLMTPFGVIELDRSYYQADNGGPVSVPLDEACGLRGLTATREVREAALFCAVHNTPEEVAQILEKIALFKPSSTAVKNLISGAGELIETQFEELMDVARKQEAEVPDELRAVAFSMDGVNVLLNEHGAQKGRHAERPGIEPSDKSSYRNAMVGSISFYGDVPEGKECPERLNARYVAQMPEDHFPTFKEKIKNEIDCIVDKIPAGVTKILLSDGQQSLWTFANSVEHWSDFERLLDFHHASEHLSHAASAIFGKGTDTAKIWYRKWRGKMLEEENTIPGLLRSMQRYVRGRMSKANREELNKQITYFTRNQSLMRYAEFRKRGLPIGSGPVEAACKTLVKQRLGRSGMRWSRTGGQHVLVLRAIVKSGRWDVLWPAIAASQEFAYAA